MYNIDNKVLEEILEAKDETKVYDKYNICFIYMLENTWGRPIKVVYVTTDKENNLCMINTTNKEVKATIKIDKLTKLLSEHAKVFKKATRELPPPAAVLDGYINEVDFKVDNTWYSDNISNLGYYDKKNIEDSEHLKEVTKLLDEVHKELSKQNKKVEKYCTLSE